MRKLALLALAGALIAGAAGCTVHSDSRARDDAREAARQAADEAKRAGEEAKEEGRRAAEEARREAEDAKREADQQAAEARREGEQARREAQRQGEEARREAEQARREARQEARDERDDNSDHDRGSSGEVVNINSADVQQIADATGVTPDIAQKIVAARPYVSKRDLVSKKVVDEKTYWKIQKNVTVMSQK